MRIIGRKRFKVKVEKEGDFGKCMAVECDNIGGGSKGVCSPSGGVCSHSGGVCSNSGVRALVQRAPIHHLRLLEHCHRLGV